MSTPKIDSCSHGPVGREICAPQTGCEINAPQARGYISRAKIIVLKFGSSVLRNEHDLPCAVHEIYRHWRSGSQVLAVVSALGDTTDELLRLAKNVSPEPEESALAILLATGEGTASALLGIALNKAGIPAKVLDPAQAGLRTIGDELDSELVAVNTARLRSELERTVV